VSDIVPLKKVDVVVQIANGIETFQAAKQLEKLGLEVTHVLGNTSTVIGKCLEEDVLKLQCHTRVAKIEID
jgi:hypothetical protein